MRLSGERTFQAEGLARQRSWLGSRPGLFEAHWGQCGLSRVREDRIAAKDVRSTGQSAGYASYGIVRAWRSCVWDGKPLEWLWKWFIGNRVEAYRSALQSAGWEQMWLRSDWQQKCWDVARIWIYFECRASRISWQAWYRVWKKERGQNDFIFFCLSIRRGRGVISWDKESLRGTCLGWMSDQRFCVEHRQFSCLSDIHLRLSHWPLGMWSANPREFIGEVQDRCIHLKSSIIGDIYSHEIGWHYYGNEYT